MSVKSLSAVALCAGLLSGCGCSGGGQACYMCRFLTHWTLMSFAHMVGRLWLTITYDYSVLH